MCSQVWALGRGHIWKPLFCLPGFPVALVERTCLQMHEMLRDPSSISRSGLSPGGGHGHTLQYSCLENPMDRGTWQATAQEVAKSWTQLKQLTHMCAHTHTLCLPHRKTKTSKICFQWDFSDINTKGSLSRRGEVILIITMVSQEETKTIKKIIMWISITS